MRLFCFAGLILASHHLWGQCQNLVPNGGFETFSALPDDDCDWFLATGWGNANTTSFCNSSNGTPDYYHINGTGVYSALPDNLYATVNPFEGDAVMGISAYLAFVTDFREYISTQLSSPLVIGETYELSFYITAGAYNGRARYFVDGMGVELTVGPLIQSGSNPININPFFEIPNVVSATGWEQCTLTFVADQPYQFITIGNFSTDSQLNIVADNNPDNFKSAYYFVDDISITTDGQAPIVDLGADQIVCGNGQVTLDAGNPGATYLWSTNETTPTIAVGTPGIYSVTVTGACGSATDQVNVDILPNEQQTLDESICTGETYTLNGEDYSTGGTYFQTVSGGASNGCDLEITLTLTEDDVETQTLTESICAGGSYELNGETYTAAGTYTQTVPGGASNGCDLKVTLNLVEEDLQVTIEVDNNNIDEGESILLTPLLSIPDTTGLLFNWSPTEGLSCIDCLKPLATPLGDIIYTFTLTDEQGCQEEAEIAITVRQARRNQLYLPNIFSPNGDGRNDVFLPYFADPDEIKQIDRFQVFSRWGELIFSQEHISANDPELGWDGLFNGQLMNSGVFVFVLQYTDLQDKERVVAGEFTLIR